MRWSTEPQTWGDSERRQDQLAQDWCHRNGMVLQDQTYADRGVSGWRGANRLTGELGALLKIVRPGDIILVEDTDRWSREPVLDALSTLRDTVNGGVEIVFLKTGVRVNKSNFNDPSVLFTNFFGSYLANSENEKRSYRIRQAMEAKRQSISRGQIPFGRLPAWLEWNAPPHRPGRHPVVVEAKAELVRRVFDLCLQGKGVRAIERLVRDQPPISNSKRAGWNTRFIHRLLRDKAVLGWFIPTETPGIYPAVVSEEVFYAAQSKLEGRRHLTVREACAGHNLFTRLVRCSNCGHPLVRHTSRSNGRVYAYLFCTGKLHGLAPNDGAGCGSGLRYDYLERIVLDLVCNSPLVQRLLAGPQPVSRIDQLKGELVSAERAVKKWFDLIEDDAEPSPMLVNALKSAEKRKAQLEQELGDEEAKAAVYRPPVEVHREVREVAAQIVSGCPDYRQTAAAALRQLVNRIVVNGVRREFEIQFHDCTGTIRVALEKDKVRELWLCDLPTAMQSRMGPTDAPAAVSSA